MINKAYYENGGTECIVKEIDDGAVADFNINRSDN